MFALKVSGNNKKGGEAGTISVVALTSGAGHARADADGRRATKAVERRWAFLLYSSNYS